MLGDWESRLCACLGISVPVMTRLYKLDHYTCSLYICSIVVTCLYKFFKYCRTYSDMYVLRSICTSSVEYVCTL